MSNTSLETLQKSLLELSKSGTIHYEVTAQELAQTRAAILTIEGVDLEAVTNYAARL